MSEGPPRYPTDLTDARWALVGPFLPPACRRGRPRSRDRRRIMDAILYVLHTGCAWRLLPRDFGPWQTTYHYLRAWRATGLGTGYTRPCAVPCASPPGARRTHRSASPTARRCAPPKGEPRGYDGGKRACGRKRHLPVDRLGLLISVSVGPASEHDQRGAKRPLAGLKPLQPRLAVVYADGAYAVGALHAWCRAHAGVELRVVPRPRVPRFEVLPRRWIVERTFAWLGRDRRLAKDYEWRVQTTELLIKVAMVGLMLRRLTATR